MLVDAHDEGAVNTLARGGDDDLFRPGLKVSRHLVLLAELPRGFQHDIHPQGGPGKVRQRGGHLGDGDLLAVDQEFVFRGGDVGGEDSVHGVVFQQMGQYRRFCPGIDGDDFNIFMAVTGPDQITTHSSETIDCDFNAHL